MNIFTEAINKIHSHSSESNEQIFHEIQQVLRVSGINLLFRKLAKNHPDFLNEAWNNLRPILETIEFEEAANRIRSEAIELADSIGKADSKKEVEIGESQAFHIRGALDLYQYITPKLLLVTTLMIESLEKKKKLTSGESGSLFIKGVPYEMLPMEMVEENPSDKHIQNVFDEIKEAYQLKTINSVYRTLALWPNYLESSWRGLKPMAKKAEFTKAANDLIELSVEQAAALNFSGNLAMDKDKSEMLLKEIKEFQRVIPFVILNVSLLQLDWRPKEQAKASPFPLEQLSTARSLQ